MQFTNQIKEYLSELSERLGKSEKEIIEIAVFNFYQDRSQFIFSPYSQDMWIAEEIPSADAVVTIIDSTGKEFKWIQFPDTEESRKIIGSRIKELREEAGLTQEQLAEKTGLKQQNIARIEQGKYSTGQDILSKIATALGKRLDII